MPLPLASAIRIQPRSGPARQTSSTSPPTSASRRGRGVGRAHPRAGQAGAADAQRALQRVDQRLLVGQPRHRLGPAGRVGEGDDREDGHDPDAERDGGVDLALERGLDPVALGGQRARARSATARASGRSGPCRRPGSRPRRARPGCAAAAAPTLLLPLVVEVPQLGDRRRAAGDVLGSHAARPAPGPAGRSAGWAARRARGSSGRGSRRIRAARSPRRAGSRRGRRGRPACRPGGPGRSRRRRAGGRRSAGRRSRSR